MRIKTPTFVAWLVLLAIWPGPAASQSDALMVAYDRVLELHGEGKYEAAVPAAEKVLRMSEREFGRGHPITAVHLSNLASL